MLLLKNLTAQLLCPSWWPAAVIWRRRAAVVPYAPSSSAACRRGCGSCGTIRVQQAGSPSCGWWSSGLLATGRALPCRVEGSGGLPGGRCRGGRHGRGPTRSVRRPRVSPKCRPCAISCHPAAPCGAGAAARALRARWPSVFGLAAAGAVPHSHRGAPVRPACRRGAAVGVAAAMIPVHSDPPASCRRAAVSQFAAEKDYPGACDHSDSAAPRRGDPRFVRRITSTRTCVL